MRTATQLKAHIRNRSKELGVSPVMLMQSYMLERLLERISASKYSEQFILKGGMLISSMVGIFARQTMDIDMTLKGASLGEENLKRLFEEILPIDVGDHVRFSLVSVTSIRQDDAYGGYRISLGASLDTIRASVKVDVTAGDRITPSEVHFDYKLLFEDRMIRIPAYNTETILAEKYETVVSRALDNTRPRDFYDLYLLIKLYGEQIDKAVLSRAIQATAAHRESKGAMLEAPVRLKAIQESGIMNERWLSYGREYGYARDISFDEVMGIIEVFFGGIEA